MQISVESQLDRSTDQFLRKKLDEHNEPFVGPRKTEEFGLTMRNEEGNIVAGVVAQCVYNWLHINVIWVSEDLRGQGHGDNLIEAAEAEGKRRGCQNAMLHTFSFQAKPFYEKHGYQNSGELVDFPEGHSQYKMYKSLADE